MRIAFVSSEVFPYSKTGGLADIAYFLPLGLAESGHEITIFTPYYQSISKYHHLMKPLGRKNIVMGGIETSVNYFTLKDNGVTIIFVQNMHYFERDKFYGYNDDAERFTCFSYAVLECIDLMEYLPEILHLNDWQTGMIPYLLDNHYRSKDKYRHLHTLLTIHNLEYQGNFDTYVARFFNKDLEYTYIHFERVNFLKAGIETASMINTVSPSYRDEILTRAYGFGLDGALQKRSHHLVGILNGINDQTFNPKTDRYIKNYTFDTYLHGKIANKKALYEAFNLGSDYHLPLIVYVGRYAGQKGLWMIKEAIEEVINQSNAKFFFLGSGDLEYTNYFKFLADKYPKIVGSFDGYNEQLAHKLYAAADIFLMPSEFEPCGLGQMISMKYGTLPIVRETGGLKDTVIPFNKYTSEGTGFSFPNLSSTEFKEKIYEAISLYHLQPKVWQKLVGQAMENDFSNSKMAQEYIKLYEKIVGE